MRSAVRACATATVLASMAVVTVALAGPAGAAPAPPAAPAEIELTANTDSSITLEWPASVGATSYRIYRGTAAGGEGTTPIATDDRHRVQGRQPEPDARSTSTRSPRSTPPASRPAPTRTRRRRRRRSAPAATWPASPVGNSHGLLRQGRPARRLRLVPDADRLVPAGARLVRGQLARRPGRSTWPTPRRAP